MASSQNLWNPPLCRAVQDGFLLSDLPDLRLLLVKLIAQTQANTCLSCPISCSTTPGVTRTTCGHVARARTSWHQVCTAWNWALRQVFAWVSAINLTCPGLVNHMSARLLHVICVLSVHGHMLCTSSALHPWSLGAWTIFYCVAGMLNCFCTLSGHCSHLIRICVICACAYIIYVVPDTRHHTDPHTHISAYYLQHLHQFHGQHGPELSFTQEFVIEWNLWQECWIVSFQDYVNDLHLCCWFSLHVIDIAHLICMYMSSACYLHMRIMHILSAVVLHMFFITDNAYVIYMSSLLLFIDPYMLYTHIHIICYVSFTFLI